MNTLHVQTASASYPVHIGPGVLQTLGRRLERLAAARRIFVLTSPPIWALWGKRFLSSFREDRQPTVLFLPPGEPRKRLAEVERLAAELSTSGADRSSLLVAFGGGVVGDLGGFLAAIYMRGIPYVQVPTTLLAQVDSSIGGKTGVNLTTGKNLVGSFHQPLAVFADVEALKTLPARERNAGLFESVKAGIIRDPKLFRFMEQNHDKILACETAAITRVVTASVAMKAGVVGLDEHESGLRMILNFGHTLGHAIEAATGYKKLLHGEAIAWGMFVGLNISRSRGILGSEEAMRMEQLIRTYGPLPRFRARVPTLIEAAGRDKKNHAGTRRFVLTPGIGHAVVVEDVTDAEIVAALTPVLREAAR